MRASDMRPARTFPGMCTPSWNIAGGRMFAVRNQVLGPIALDSRSHLRRDRKAVELERCIRRSPHVSLVMHIA